MAIERSSSIRPPPPPRLTGSAHGSSGALRFEVSGARRLSLDVAFLDAPPVDGAVFDDVLLGGTEGREHVKLGRCRFETGGPGAPLSAGSIVQFLGGRAGRIVPIDAPINCAELLKHGRIAGIEQTFDQLPLLLARKDAITPEFQRYTADLVYDLRIHRSLFEDVDAGLSVESAETRADIERMVMAGPGRRFMRFLDDRLAALAEIVRSFSRQEHERHGFYFRRHVWDAIRASPFLERTNLRPRGYAGDSMMMQYLYEDAYEGTSLFGKLMHKHPVESAAAQAVRNRRRLIAETIAEARRSRAVGAVGAGEPLRFISVACGPAWEVADLFKTPADCDTYACSLLDQDEEALGEAERRIMTVEAALGRRVQARYVRQSVRTMLRTRDLPDALGRYAVVYSMGLFDYLTAPVARAVLRKLYEIVEPGGRMIIGNFHVGNPTRWYMDYWMDWSLIYRTEDEFLDLARDLPGAECSVSFEATRAQMFLAVRKAAT